MSETKTKNYEAPYYGLPHGSSKAALDYDAHITELRAGPEGFVEFSMSGRLPRRDEPGIYDDLHYEPSGMPPEFWRAILFAAGAASVFWVGSFFALRAYLGS